MAILSMDELLAGISAGRRQNIYKASMTAEGAGTFQSLIKAVGNPASRATNPATGSGQIPTKDDTYTLNFADRLPGNSRYLAKCNFSSSVIGSLVIYDRLWENSGLVGNVVTAQAINSLPLTRYVDGGNVEIFGEIYTAIGATATTFSVTYTDANDVSRVATYAHPANAESVGQMFLFNPPAGAYGCKSIQSAILAATTGTAGNWGITLVRRIAEIPMPIVNIPTVYDAFQLGMPDLEIDSALCFMVQCSGTASGNIIGAIDLIEG